MMIMIISCQIKIIPWIFNDSIPILMKESCCFFGLLVLDAPAEDKPPLAVTEPTPLPPAPPLSKGFI